MNSQQTSQTDQQQATPSQPYRLAVAVLLVIVTGAYTGGILMGWIPENRRIDTITLLIIGLTALMVLALLRPESFGRLRLLEWSGFKLEMLEEVRQTQQEHGSQLADIALVLPLLLPETERRHLLNLADDNTAGYRGNHAMRTEVRRLRSIGLIRMRSDHTVGQMTDGAALKLTDYVELTASGHRWVDRIRDIEKMGEAR